MTCWARELEYRWMECGVYQGESEENLLRDDGTFTLRQNGYSVNYQSSSVQQDGSSTLITNTLDNTIDYQVAKDWQDEQGQPMQGSCRGDCHPADLPGTARRTP